MIKVNGKVPPEPSTENWKCPVCGKDNMVVKDGYYGKFYGCRGFPNCKGTRDFYDPEGEGIGVSERFTDVGNLLGEDQY